MDGYVFEGWYDGNTKAVAGSYRVYKNVTLVAKWRESSTPAVNYTITYQSEHGTAPNPFSAASGTILNSSQLPALSVDGYVFAGWYDGDTKVEAGVYTVTKDVVLTGKWILLVTVSYYTYYENNCPSPIRIVPGTALTSEQLPELSYDGYIFEGWYYGDTKVVAGEFTVTENVTIDAKWTRNSSITVKLSEHPSDITLNSKEENGTLILTADEDFTNYSWRIDDKVQSETSNTLILDTSTWTRGYYEVSVEAEKDGEFYSASAYITVGGN